MSKLLQLLYCYFSIKENTLKLVVLLTFRLILKVVEWPLKPIESYWFSYFNCLFLFIGLFMIPLKDFKSIWWRYHRTIKQGFCLFEDPILHILSSQLQTTLQCMMNAKLSISRAQVNHSVLNDIEQYRRNRWYSNIVHIMRNHSGLTKTFLD